MLSSKNETLLTARTHKPMKNTLELFLITYNRKEKCHLTLQTLLAEDSPVRDLPLTILDNASTDGTEEMLAGFAQKHTNIRLIRHPRNIGGNANIVRAFELATSPFMWVLCDDDSFNWKHWKEIETAILSNDYDMIYTINHLVKKNDKMTPGYLAFLAAFLPGVIYKTQHITNDIIQNMYGMVHTWYPQSSLSLHVLFNLNGKYFFPQNNLIIRGAIEDTKQNVASLTRGTDKNILHPDLTRMFWHVGFIKVAQIISNKKVRYQVIKTTNFNERWNESFFSYCKSILKYNKYYKENNQKNLNDVYINLSKKQKFIFILASIIFSIKSFFRRKKY